MHEKFKEFIRGISFCYRHSMAINAIRCIAMRDYDLCDSRFPYGIDKFGTFPTTLIDAGAAPECNGPIAEATGNRHWRDAKRSRPEIGRQSVWLRFLKDFGVAFWFRYCGVSNPLLSPPKCGPRCNILRTFSGRTTFGLSLLSQSSIVGVAKKACTSPALVKPMPAICP